MRIIITCQKCGRKTDSCTKCACKEFKISMNTKMRHEFVCLKCGEPYTCPCFGNVFQLERVK